MAMYKVRYFNESRYFELLDQGSNDDFAEENAWDTQEFTSFRSAVTFADRTGGDMGTDETSATGSKPWTSYGDYSPGGLTVDQIHGYLSARIDLGYACDQVQVNPKLITVRALCTQMGIEFFTSPGVAAWEVWVR